LLGVMKRFEREEELLASCLSKRERERDATKEDEGSVKSNEEVAVCGKKRHKERDKKAPKSEHFG
jgi:hypothetical protein